MKNTERTSNYVCVDCGARFLTEDQKKEENVITFHIGKCGVCSLEKSVTNIKHYNFLTKPIENENKNTI